MCCCALEGWSSVAGRKMRETEANFGAGIRWSESQSRRRSAVHRVWSLVAWWFVRRSCAPDDAGVAASPGLGGFDTTHTLPPLLGSSLGRPREVLAPRADCGTAQHHSTAQRNPGLACWWRSALIGPVPAGWRTEDAEDASLLQTRLACGRWEPRSGQGRGSEGRVEFESRGCRAGFEGCAQVVLSPRTGRRGKSRCWRWSLITNCCKGSLCCPGRSPRGGQQRAACVGSTRQDRGRERLCEAS